jgi:hypothetical protein
MKLRELKEKINQIDEKFLDYEVEVDTEGAEYICHMVSIDGLYIEDHESMGVYQVYLTLDNECKIHRPNNCKNCGYYKVALEYHSYLKENGVLRSIDERL